MKLKSFVFSFIGFLFLLSASFFPVYSQGLQQQIKDTPFKEFLDASAKGEEGYLNKQWYDKETFINIVAAGAAASATVQPNEDGTVTVSGAVPLMGRAISELTGTPAISSVEYFADIGSRLNLVPQAYAQGTGWRALTPILSIWKAFRNLAYIFFVIVFIVIGFMIMFRAKINPQTVISIQSALPKIVVTLLLITFSYAIAGLFIDFIYILIYVVVGLFEFTDLVSNSTEVVRKLLEDNLFQIMYAGKNIFIAGPAEAIQDVIAGLLGEGVFGEFLDWLGVDNFGGSILAHLIIAVALLFVIFKLFFTLLLTYVGIIVSIIFSPIILLFNALPGSNSFTGWVKSLLANILAFPAVALMFLLAAVIIGNPTHESGSCDPSCAKDNPWCVQCDVGYFSQRTLDLRAGRETGSGETEVWIPPFLSLVGGSTGGSGPIMSIIALGMIFMTGQVPAMIKKVMGVEEGVGAMGFQAIAGGISAPFQAQSAIQQYREQRQAKRLTQAQLKAYTERGTGLGA